MAWRTSCRLHCFPSHAHQGLTEEVSQLHSHALEDTCLYWEQTVREFERGSQATTICFGLTNCFRKPFYSSLASEDYSSILCVMFSSEFAIQQQRPDEFQVRYIWSVLQHRDEGRSERLFGEVFLVGVDGRGFGLQ
jgi:hypothetical protein